MLSKRCLPPPSKLLLLQNLLLLLSIRLRQRVRQQRIILIDFTPSLQLHKTTVFLLSNLSDFSRSGRSFVQLYRLLYRINLFTQMTGTGWSARRLLRHRLAIVLARWLFLTLFLHLLLHREILIRDLRSSLPRLIPLHLLLLRHLIEPVRRANRLETGSCTVRATRSLIQHLCNYLNF